MGRLRNFLQLRLADQWLLLKSMFLLAMITVGLRVLSFQTLRCFLAKLAQGSIKAPPNFSPLRIAWAVQVTSRYVPQATCLPQALAVQILLKRRGYPASLQIGVAKSKDGQLEAHAWVESQGQVVIGGSENLARFSLLPVEGENNR